MTFEGETMVVNGDEKTSYAFDDLDESKAFDFTEMDKSAVELHNADVIRVVNQDGRTLMLQNAPANIQVNLVNAGGQIMLQTRTDAEGGVAIDLPSQNGVYVLVVGNNSFKVIRK